MQQVSTAQVAALARGPTPPSYGGSSRWHARALDRPCRLPRDRTRGRTGQCAVVQLRCLEPWVGCWPRVEWGVNESPAGACKCVPAKSCMWPGARRMRACARALVLLARGRVAVRYWGCSTVPDPVHCRLLWCLMHDVSPWRADGRSTLDTDRLSITVSDDVDRNSECEDPDGDP